MSAFPLQQFKGVLMLPPVSVASTTATQISYFDMAGTGQVLATAPTGPVSPCEGALFIFMFGSVGSPSTGTIHKLTEADTYNGSPTAYADISGAALTVAPAASSFSCIYLTNRGRKRFIKAVNTTDSTQVIAVMAIACTLDQAAVTISEIGAKCLETLVL
jgi:hypothetical protein